MGGSMFGGGYGYGGGLMSFLPFIVIGVILLVIVISAAARGRRSNNANLILEEFNFNETADEFLKIKGRASGFINWIKSLLGKAPTTYLIFNKQLLRVEGEGIKNNIPLLNVSCVSYGMLKSSILFLVLGIIFIIAGFAIPTTYGTLLGIIIGAIFIIIWVINRKTLYLGVSVNENAPLVIIKMKRGIINSLDLNKIESATNTLTDIVLKNAGAK
ncbi:MAG: hypothetical protein LBC80_07325 [Treponema sp.]|nr:hypothetical protein [Treponema sp.]